MACHDSIRDRDECLIGPRRALDARFVTNSTLPFIAAGRRITTFLTLGVFPSECKDILAAAEQATKDCYLLGVRRVLIDPAGGRRE